MTETLATATKDDLLGKRLYYSDQDITDLPDFTAEGLNWGQLAARAIKNEEDFEAFRRNAPYLKMTRSVIKSLSSTTHNDLFGKTKLVEVVEDTAITGSDFPRYDQLEILTKQDNDMFGFCYHPVNGDPLIMHFNARQMLEIIGIIQYVLAGVDLPAMAPITRFREPVHYEQKE